MKIVIKPCLGGATVQVDRQQVCIYKFNSENLSDLQELLWEIGELLSPMECNSRYAKRKIRVSVVHGDKFECKEADCPLCDNAIPEDSERVN